MASLYKRLQEIYSILMQVVRHKRAIFVENCGSPKWEILLKYLEGPPDGLQSSQDVVDESLIDEVFKTSLSDLERLKPHNLSKILDMKDSRSLVGWIRVTGFVTVAQLIKGLIEKKKVSETNRNNNAESKPKNEGKKKPQKDNAKKSQKAENGGGKSDSKGNNSKTPHEKKGKNANNNQTPAKGKKQQQQGGNTKRSASPAKAPIPASPNFALLSYQTPPEPEDLPIPEFLKRGGEICLGIPAPSLKDDDDDDPHKSDARCLITPSPMRARLSSNTEEDARVQMATDHLRNFLGIGNK